MSFSAYGVMPPPPFFQWPQDGPLQQPGSRRLYPYVASFETSNGTDALTIVEASIAPSGAGEASIESVAVTGDTIDVLMVGGVPGRRYIVQLLLTVTSTQIFEVLVSFPIDGTLAVWPLPAPPSLSFGPVTIWQATTGSQLQDSGGNLLTDSSGNALFGSP
jgi:hypothetical protein